MKPVDFKYFQRFDLKAYSSEACLRLYEQREVVWVVFGGNDKDTAGLQIGMETCKGYLKDAFASVINSDLTVNKNWTV